MKGNAMKHKYNKLEAGYDSLARSIIYQAAIDYKTALRRYKRNETDYWAIKDIKNIESFFLGDWCLLLCGNIVEDGSYFINKLQKYVENKK